MSGAYFNHAGVFLVQTLFGLFILAIMLRFLLQAVRADFYNPLVQALVKLTSPVLVPVRRFVPGFMGLDLAALLLMLALKMVELIMAFSIAGRAFNIAGLLVLAIGDLFNLLLNIMLFAIIGRVILSWVNPDYRQPAVALIYQLTEPVMRPARGLIPPLGGFDLSPILVLIIIQLIKILLVWPIWDLSKNMLA